MIFGLRLFPFGRFAVLLFYCFTVLLFYCSTVLMVSYFRSALFVSLKSLTLAPRFFLFSSSFLHL